MAATTCRYSCRSASDGSTRDARSDGTNAAYEPRQQERRALVGKVVIVLA